VKYAQNLLAVPYYATGGADKRGVSAFHPTFGSTMGLTSLKSANGLEGLPHFIQGVRVGQQAQKRNAYQKGRTGLPSPPFLCNNELSIASR
jgi:hypothetical protein